MIYPQNASHRLAGSTLSILALVLTASLAVAVPFHEPTVNGTITGDGTDWDPADLVVNDIADDNLARTANVRRLWLTWDQDNLYLGVTYQDFGAGEALAVYVDLDRGVGPGTATVLENFAGNFRMPADHGFELVLGRGADEGFPGTAPTAYLVDDAEGTMTDIIGSVVSAQAFNTGAKSATQFPFWLNAEFALPWSTLYPDLAGGVRPYAVIKAVAVVTGADATLNGIDSAPDASGLDGGTGAVTFDRLHASVVDSDGDGVPDPSGGSISGLAVLPDDPGTGSVTASAVLTGFSGRDPDGPLSVTTTTAGSRDWTLPRLPAGSYEVTLSAEGYFPVTFAVEVGLGEEVTGLEQELAKATAIRGDIGFATGGGSAGSAVLTNAAGAELARREFTADGGSYVFYVQTGGLYEVTVEADTYLPASRTVTITEGVDVEGFDFVLVRQTEISGTVSFESGPGFPGTLDFLDGGGGQLGSVSFASTGGSFAFYTPDSGQYTLSASARTYVPVDSTLTVTAGQDVTGIELVLPRAPEITGTISFEGPAAAGLLEVFDATSGARRDTLRFSEADEPFSFFLEPGRFRFELNAPGYLPFSQEFTVGSEAQDLGALQLLAVRATRMLLVDAQDREIPEVRGTKSIPADDLWFLARVDLLAVDEEGRIDRFDLGGNLTGFVPSSRKMDDVSDPTGSPAFYASESREDPAATLDFADGHCTFWMTNDAVEVLRVYLKQPEKDPLAGRIAVAFLDPQPTLALLTAADGDTLLTADGLDAVTIRAQLFDAALNPSRIADLPVTFLIDESSSGRGQFELATTTTNGDGEATASLIARGAGTLNITCNVVVNNRVLEVRGEDLESAATTLRITAEAGPASGWRLQLPGTLSPMNTPLDVTAQVIDDYGNTVKLAGRTAQFGALPADLGSFEQATAVTDTSGRATAVFRPAGRAGLVGFTVDGGGLTGDSAEIQLGDLFLTQDPIWYNEPADHQTFEQTDLTTVIVDNTADELVLDIAFSTNWAGMQLHVLLETNFDAMGGTVDPFAQPVTYDHDLLPDFVLTGKYSANDYGDFRAWRNNRWEWWSPEAGEYQTGSPTGQNIQNVWTTKGAESFTVRIPFDPFETRPDSVMIEVYLTQDENDVKRSAFDSVPSDATLNLDFDPFNPGPSDWDIATNPVTLSAWSAPYRIKTDFPTPPEITEVTADPAAMQAGDGLAFSAQITDGGDGIGDVLADLSEMGGASLVRMFDDGDEAHADQTAGDGIYSLGTIVPPDNPGGKQTLTVKAYDASNRSVATGTAEIEVTAILEPLLYVEDATGDDHGPNQPGMAGLYYTYPTNIAFVDGAFDITSLTVFETRQSIGGEQVEMLAFQVAMGDFPDPADEGTADWNPDHADLNIQKIDILIDNAPGGATASLPNRLAAFQAWDAWDYAVIMDGWFKALVPSLGQNTTDSWRANALTSDRDIILRSDPELNTVTALVSKEALGNPTAEDVRNWDIAVCMASHDFGGEEVLGGIRWVNAKRGEWQFGGGYRDDGDNRDPNLMDLLLIPGAGHDPGLPQEEVLDYESDAALARYKEGKTSVAIEMSALADTGPPVIDTGGGGSVVTQVRPIAGAPLALALKITDDYRVDEAVFRYRSTGYEGEGWDREVAMGALGNDLWVVDIMPSWLDSNLVYSPVDSTRYIEFEVWAVDGSIERKESTSPVTTLQIWPDSICRPQTAMMEDEELDLLQLDGSGLSVGKGLRNDLVAAHIASAWTGGEADADTMGRFVELIWDVCGSSGVVAGAQSVPPAKPLGVYRDIYLATSDSLGGEIDYTGDLPRSVELSLHYPQVWLPAGKDENKVGMFRYNPAANRWVLLGGHVSTLGNKVTATVSRAGTYGLFHVESLDYRMGDVISGIDISPNPFSPNGDGLYDEATISFFLDRTASVTVEIFNIDGERKTVLQETFEYQGDELEGGVPRRVPGLIWDGTDLSGNSVPYGIYVLRITALSGPDTNKRKVRSNHSLAVIK